MKNIRESETQLWSAATRKYFFEEKLVLAHGRCVGIFAERAGVTVRQNLDHPTVKIIHGMIHDGFETAVVFAMSFLNVVFQSDAEIFIFAAQANLFRPQHFNILHGNFRHPICTSVQFLFLSGKVVDVKVSGEFAGFFGAGRDGDGFQLDGGMDKGRWGWGMVLRCRTGGHWGWNCGRWAYGFGCCGWRFDGDGRSQARDFGFERRTLRRLKGYRDESRKNFQRSVEGGGSGLCAQEWREGVRRPVAGARGDHVVDGMVHLVCGTLQALEVIAEGARDGLFNGCGFLCHTYLTGLLAEKAPFCHCGRG
jgi:hypothetical protein